MAKGSAGLFDDLSGIKFLDFFVGNSPEELKAQIDQIRLPAKIISIYAIGSRHIAWVQSSTKIKKKLKEI